jgi:nicotinate phosphoribosyltransferase
MASLDLAERIHNHNFRLDPFVRSLLDTDFYKLLMCYFAWDQYRDTRVTFAVKNRSVAKVKLNDLIREEDLRAQLDYVRDLRFTEAELIWLQGNTFYGQRNIFPGDFIDFLRNLKMPEYDLGIGADGDYALSFTGTWAEVMLWEIYALSILNEARSRAGMADMSHYQLKVLYANATAKIVGKLKSLKEAGVPRISEFGTRRRHGFLWQGFVLEAMQEELGPNFLGTSNALHAMRLGLPAIGTNAHELPMVIAALARLNAPNDKDALFKSQFNVLQQWQETYGGNLLVALPDTFGTTQFLEAAGSAFPDIKNWRGFREDSKDPFIGAEEKIAFWKSVGCDPREKLQLFSDGLDVDKMIHLHRTFDGRIVDGYGWGTLATNDFRGCDPRDLDLLDPISVVCKVSEVATPDGRSITAVKLSDNYQKATGAPEEVDFYRDTFGTAGVENAPVTV